MPYTVDETQRKWAKIVGAVYVFVMGFGMFSEFYVFGNLLVFDNASETARNIIAHEQLFRVATAINLLGFSADVLLITALYVVLERVNRNLALLALGFRLIETIFLMITSLADFNVLRVLSGARHLGAFEPDQLYSMARLSLNAHHDAYLIALLIFGFGSSVYCYLWLKSGYIPKALAALGLFGSVLAGASQFAFIAFPGFEKVFTVEYYAAPIFLFELSIGLWLLLRPLRPPTAAHEQ